MVALVLREPQRAGDRGDHRLGRPRAAALLEPRVEVGRHARQRGDLLAAQPGRSPSPPRGEADVLGPQRFAAPAQEVRESVSVHDDPVSDAARAISRDELSLDQAASGAAAERAPRCRAMTRIALITGANRGIGRSTALQLARDGVDVILTYHAHADEAAAVVAEIAALGRTRRRAAARRRRRRVLRRVRRHRHRRPARDLGPRPLRLPGQQRRDGDRRRLRRGHRAGLRPPRRRPLQGRLLPHPDAAGPAGRRRLDRERLHRPDPLHRPAAGGLRRRSRAPSRCSRATSRRSSGRAASPSTRSPRARSPPTSAAACCATTQQVREHIVSLTALGRHAVADDIGGAIASLLGDGNRWVTGQRIEVSGGLHL